MSAERIRYQLNLTTAKSLLMELHLQWYYRFHDDDPLPDLEAVGLLRGRVRVVLRAQRPGGGDLKTTRREVNNASNNCNG